MVWTYIGGSMDIKTMSYEKVIWHLNTVHSSSIELWTLNTLTENRVSYRAFYEQNVYEIVIPLSLIEYYQMDKFDRFHTYKPEVSCLFKSYIKD